MTTTDIVLNDFRPHNYVAWTPAIPTSPAVIAWQKQLTRYRNYWPWFTGEALDEEDTAVKSEDGQPVYLYPLKINPIQIACGKHAAALFGEVPDEADSMLRMTYKNDENRVDDRCKKHSNRINRIWYDSNGKELQGTIGIYNQFLGGSFVKCTYDPLDPMLRHKVKFESIAPDFCLPIYNSANFWEILEMWVMYYISEIEAKERFGLKDIGIGYGGKVMYAEHWMPDKYEIQVGGIVPTLTIGQAEMTLSQPNPFGFVPFVYIPHPPRVGTFYGTSHVPSMIGLTEELNSRMADVGDYVRDNSQSFYWMRNVTSKITTQRIDARRVAISLGNKVNLTGGSDPEISRLDSAQGSQIHIDYNEELVRMIDRASHLSPVAYGEDEGSQRSAATLAARMWSLTSHIRQERMLLTTGIRRLNWMATKIMAVKGISDVQESDLYLKAVVGYYPTLPRDRQEEVDEVVKRKQAAVISTRGAVEKLSDGDDTEQMVEEIEQDLDAEAKREMDIAEAGKPEPQPAKPA